MLSDLYLCDFLHNETLRGKKNVYIAWFNFLVEMEMKLMKPDLICTIIIMWHFIVLTNV